MTYTEVLNLIEYPEEVLVIDFETYFDTHYSLTKLSTIEYIHHRMFEFTGMGISSSAHLDGKPEFIPAERPYSITGHLCLLQNELGPDFENATVVVKNAKFDIVILQTKFGIVPEYIIDIDDLLRHYDSKMSHKMKDVAPMFGLQAKGDTQKFKGLHYGEMSTLQKSDLQAYCLNDIDIEKRLFQLLLPQMSNPEVEIQLARHTLDLYLFPKIRFDFSEAKKLKGKMQAKLNSTLEKIDWVLDYEN